MSEHANGSVVPKGMEEAASTDRVKQPSRRVFTVNRIVSSFSRLVISRGPIAINAFFDLYTGGKRRPVFFDTQQTCPELLEMDKHYHVIREELGSILPRKKNIPRYHEIDGDQYQISATVDKEKDWKVFMLYAMGEKPKSNRELCPQTSALLDKVLPHLFQAFFSILDAGKSIPDHCGPYRGYLRYHLGIKVPDKNPPKIRIKDQFYTWEEGKSVLFDDSWSHEVYNESDDIRVVLVVDILRPMPFWPHCLNVIVTFVLRYLYAQRILRQVLQRATSEATS